MDTNIVPDLCESGPVYIKVRDHIRQQINKMNVGDKLPTEVILAKRYSVARGTVGRAIEDLEQEGFVFRHKRRGTFVKKVEDHKTAANKELGTMAVVVPEVEMIQIDNILKGIREEADQRGFSLHICRYGEKSRPEKEVLLDLAKDKFKGVLIYPMFTLCEPPDIDEYADTIRQVSENGNPVVLMEIFVPTIECLSVMTDYMKVGYRATEHLISLGHNRIGYVSTGYHDIAGQAAVTGYRNALRDNKIPYSEQLVVNIPVRFSAEPAREAVKHLIQDDPLSVSAIATSHFSMTHGILSGLADIKLRVPEDIAVVGCDVFTNPALNYVTHLLQPHEEIGKTAVKVLLQNETEAQLKLRWFVPPRLIIGNTCGYRRG